jgi:hypothetical protein
MGFCPSQRRTSRANDARFARGLVEAQPLFPHTQVPPRVGER